MFDDLFLIPLANREVVWCLCQPLMAPVILTLISIHRSLRWYMQLVLTEISLHLFVKCSQQCFQLFLTYCPNGSQLISGKAPHAGMFVRPHFLLNTCQSVISFVMIASLFSYLLSCSTPLLPRDFQKRKTWRSKRCSSNSSFWAKPYGVLPTLWTLVSENTGLMQSHYGGIISWWLLNWHGTHRDHFLRMQRRPSRPLTSGRPLAGNESWELESRQLGPRRAVPLDGPTGRSCVRRCFSGDTRLAAETTMQRDY